jgi:hypothetical protein
LAIITGGTGATNDRVWFQKDEITFMRDEGDYRDGLRENQGDFNDADNAVNPDAEEVFDGVDNSFDGTVDECFDEDCDGYQSEESGDDDCDDNDRQ